jgi:[ribosomal protein S18]-alanine N-acetyltransferase
MPQNSDAFETIRLAELTDCSRLHKIGCAASQFPWTIEAIENELQNPYGLNFVMLSPYDRLVCGFIFSVVIADELSIHNLVTHPEFQRRGIAQRLLETTITRARERSAIHAYLEVRSKNIPAVALYNKLGFLTHSVRKKYYSGDNDDALIMNMKI